MDQMTQANPDLVDRLNDLLRLDHDAIQAYTLALESMENASYRETIGRFRADHTRHVEQLSHLIRIHHGTPAELPAEDTGAFRLAVERVGSMAGGDTGFLLAFKASERQVRDRYRTASEADHAEEVATVIARSLEDASRHYAWATSVLEMLGVDESSLAARAGVALDSVQETVSEAIESAQKSTKAALRSKRGIAMVVGSALAVVGAGAVAAYLTKKR